MHERGYSYIGPTSFYLLTMDEIRRLQRGYVALHKDKSQKPRSSDAKKFAAFQDKIKGRKGPR